MSPTWAAASISSVVVRVKKFSSPGASRSQSTITTRSFWR